MSIMNNICLTEDMNLYSLTTTFKLKQLTADSPQSNFTAGQKAWSLYQHFSVLLESHWNQHLLQSLYSGYHWQVSYKWQAFLQFGEKLIQALVSSHCHYPASSGKVLCSSKAPFKHIPDKKKLASRQYKQATNPSHLGNII